MKSGPHAGPRRREGAHWNSWSIRAAAGDENAATSTSTTTVVVTPPVGGNGAPAIPSLPADGVGTTALDASALPALDAALSLSVDPSASSSSRGGATPPSAARSASSPFPLFEIPPAVSGMLAINLGAALFGSNMVAVKLAQSGGASPAALSAGRFALAAAFFLPSALSSLRKEIGSLEERGEEGEGEESSPSFFLTRSGIELGLYLFGGYTGQAIGLSLTTASKGAFASAFTVLTVPFLQAAASALGKGKSSSSPPPASTWVAAAAAVAGVFLLTSDGGSSSGSAATAAAGANLGDLLCVLSAILFGVHKWRSEQLVGRISSVSGGSGGGEREGPEGSDDSSSGSSSSSSSSNEDSSSGNNEETVRSLVSLQLCVLAIASLALCAPEAASAVKGALADQKSLFDHLASSSSSLTSSSSQLELYGAVASQLCSEFSALPWALFAYMGLFT